MSERGILRLVIEGEDAQLFHDGLTELIAESKKNPDYRIEDPSGELYWCIGEDDEGYRRYDKPVADVFRLDGYDTLKAYYQVANEDKLLGDTGDTRFFEGKYSLEMYLDLNM